MFEHEACLPATPQALESTLRALALMELEEGFEVASLLVHENAPAPSPTELPPELMHAGARRRATFHAGRNCAHRALGALGSAPVAIPITPSGAPLWPAGFVGSISHTDRLAAAIVACTPPVTGVGLDVDDDICLDDDRMVRLICRPEESLPGHDADDPASLRHGKLLFVVKEAVYKLHRPLGGDFLEFHELAVTIDTSTSRFLAELVAPHKQGSAGTVFTGSFSCDHGLLVALTARHESRET